MAAWTLIDSLAKLRAEFNTLAPNRDKGADGAIGDSSHTSSSDHTPDEDSRVLRDHDGDDKNEVHALDVDSDGPWPGAGTQKQRFHAINMRIIAGEKAKWQSATDKCRLNYMIWDRKIYDKDNDFEPRNYTGSDPHTNHAHFSGRYETACENDTRPWGVLPTQEWSDMATKDEIKAALREVLAATDGIDEADADEVARAILNKPLGRGTRTVGMVLQAEDEPLIADLANRLTTLEGGVAEILRRLPAAEPGEPTDPPTEG